MKKQNITLSLALATIFSSSVALAEIEVTGKVIHETAMYTQGGLGVGAAKSGDQTSDSHDQDVFKSATHARIFFDGELDEMHEGATFHAELNAFYDLEAPTKDYEDNESYTQRDFLREAYIDAEIEDISLRVGKQQVVWGTADGMKLLDAINPTDYTEMAQNQMEDSRIPVWMINAEADVPTGGSVQVVISEAKSSVFAGLGKTSAATTGSHSANNSDLGSPFKMKGVDTITGKVHGFLNIAPALGTVAGTVFSGAHTGGVDQGFLETNRNGEKLTVWDYSNGNTVGTFGANTGAVLCGAANVTNNQVTNLCTPAALDEDNPDATFEYMSATTFATFDTLAAISSEYRVKEANDEPNLGLRFKDSTSNGVNYSVNFMNGYDTNPSVDMHWEDGAGAKLFVGTTSAASGGTDGTSDLGSSDANLTVRLYTTQALADAAALNTAFNKVDTGNTPILVMVESLNKIQQLGGSFDTAIETAALGPVVIRGEALYQHDVESPIIDRKKLGHGDLVGGLSMVKGDVFKYVIGADITVLTNMMVSAQFIQESNLDFIDQVQTGHSEYGANLGRYTADRAALHLTNGLQKAVEHKEFYSLFFSKPFGASGEHRWNNIFMYEDGNGMWNRADVEFAIDDNTQVTLEWNQYFGDVNTQFGQLEASSNAQAGFKYSF